MKVVETSLPGVVILEPQVFGDDRGFFMETFRDSFFRDQVDDVSFVQENHSKSNQGVLRGIHYQMQSPQGKLVRVVQGEVFDVAVDLRRSSPHFGQWFGCLLSAENKRQLWVPEGFGHAFYVTTETAEFVYKCTNYYSPENERSVLWNDPDIGIEWPLVDGKEPLLSDKDAKAAVLKDADSYE